MKIIIDTREQQPYLFNGYETKTQAETLHTGDYSLSGLTNHIAIERKNIDDLASTLTTGRERFIKECERSTGLNYFGLVIESSLQDILHHRYKSRASPQSIIQSLVAFSVRFKIHIFWCENRINGELMTYSLLQKYLKEQQTFIKTIQSHEV